MWTNGGTRGRAIVAMEASPCRIAAKRLMLTGGVDHVGARLPDRGYVTHVETLAPANSS